MTSKKAPSKAVLQEQAKTKDQLIRALSAILENAGLQVRREKLKQGHGWRAVSGTCRLATEKFIFLDRKLPLEEQIDFLLERINQSKIDISAEMLIGVSPELVERVTMSMSRSQREREAQAA
jgi:hypothetical protein